MTDDVWPIFDDVPQSRIDEDTGRTVWDAGFLVQEHPDARVKILLIFRGAETSEDALAGLEEKKQILFGDLRGLKEACDASPDGLWVPEDGAAE